MNTLVAVLCSCIPIQVENPLESYREFALATTGEPARGREVFLREKVGCVKCHTVGEKTRRAGPDLAGIGDKLDLPEIVQAVLEPSTGILTGYATTTFVTQQGVVHTGILERRDPEHVEILVASGEKISIAQRTIVEEKRLETSLMPGDLHLLMSREEFADLTSYLRTLQQLVVAPELFDGLPQEIPSVAKRIGIVPFHSEEHSFTLLVGMRVVPGTVDRFLILQHNPAELWILEKGLQRDKKWLFLDLNEETQIGPDTGIVGMAFHPDFENNGKYYVYHHTKGRSASGGPLGVMLVERRATDDRRRDSGAPSRRLLHVGRWTVAHTGGAMEFGPDGMLYLGIGDGGPQEDPEGNGQNLRRFLGSILRIDVDRSTHELPYGIPPSNPLVGHPDPLLRQEIWAWGFRQPWRFSFDELTGDLWVGEVGQSKFEEVMIVRKGENHGWNVYEGHERFSDKYREEGAVYVPPIVSLMRKHGVSVTGGYVYRGTRSPSYSGVYIFGDYESRRIWGMTQRDRKLVAIREIGRAPDRIVAFGQDVAGELYMLGYNHGRVYQLRLDDSVFE
jgi:putative heme-binding domain-containing protein